MHILPPALDDLIEAFGALPGVGPKTAERYAYFILRNDKHTARKLSDALTQLHDNIGYCKKTFARCKILKSYKVIPFSWQIVPSYYRALWRGCITTFIVID